MRLVAHRVCLKIFCTWPDGIKDKGIAGQARMGVVPGVAECRGSFLPAKSVGLRAWLLPSATPGSGSAIFVVTQPSVVFDHRLCSSASHSHPLKGGWPHTAFPLNPSCMRLGTLRVLRVAPISNHPG